MQRSSREINPALDGLRGLAILAVMVFHASPTSLPGGFLGVDIFFVLSGYLITGTLISEQLRCQSISLSHFYIRRALRLTPALGLLLLTITAGAVLFGDEKIQQQVVGEAVLALLYMTNWARALDIYPLELLGHTWSLALEEQYYLLWPGIFILLLKISPNLKTLAYYALTLCLLSLTWRWYLLDNQASAMRLYNGLDTRADALMLGSALALLLPGMTSKLLQIRPALTISSCAALVGLGLFAVFADWHPPYMFYWGYALIAILSAIIILDLSIPGSSILKTFLSGRWLCWIGLISYGLYLWHYSIFVVLHKLGYSPAKVLFAGSTITFILATASYYLLERHFLGLKRRYQQYPAGHSESSSIK